MNLTVHDWFRPGCAAAFFRAISRMEYTMSFKGENITIIFDKEGQQPYIEQETTTIGRTYNLPAGRQTT